MTVSTIGEDRTPSARVLILKNIDAGGWRFASSAASDKGREPDAWPRARRVAASPTRGREPP
jgi:pyridoxamine 5'-phosphate oxidase